MAVTTPADQKKANRQDIYSYIHEHRQTSKQSIAAALELSLPTVSQHLKRLEEKELIQREGFFGSDCGRRAQIISCNEKARIAIGAEIHSKYIYLTALDLYYNPFSSRRISVSYDSSKQ